MTFRCQHINSKQEQCNQLGTILVNVWQWKLEGGTSAIRAMLCEEHKKVWE